MRECLSRGIPVRAGTRDGAFDVAASLGEDVVAASVVPWTTPRVVPVLADVTRPETIARAIATAEDETTQTTQTPSPSPPTLVVSRRPRPRAATPTPSITVAWPRSRTRASPRTCLASWWSPARGSRPKTETRRRTGSSTRSAGARDAKASGETRVVAAFRETARRSKRRGFSQKRKTNDTNGSVSFVHDRPPERFDGRAAPRRRVFGDESRRRRRRVRRPKDVAAASSWRAASTRGARSRRSRCTTGARPCLRRHSASPRF